MRRVSQSGIVSLMAFVLAIAPFGPAVAADRDERREEERNDHRPLQKIKHFVVIYQENHSFDNLYGRWERVRGLKRADEAHTRQISQSGQLYDCLLQNDINLTSPPSATTCANSHGGTFTSAFINAPFTIDHFIAPGDKCPPGCTRDLVHRFYQEQYQLNGGAMNHYVTGSDAVGLTMGVYDTKQLPIYKYLHTPAHPRYAIVDNFFQGAFGGSFLNHQWLVAAATPIFANAVQDGSTNDLHSIVDANGMPNTTALYVPTATVKDQRLTIKCPPPATVPNLACGDFAVNTTQPFFQPFSPGTAAAVRLPPLESTTIGDRLTGAGVDWAWYAGGWSNANGDVNGPGWTNAAGPKCIDPNAFPAAVFPNCPDLLFQFHHHPFNYFAAFNPGTVAGLANRKAHLRDEAEFLQLTQSSGMTCRLKPVSFVKPIGAENEHPGYTTETRGSEHLVSLIDAIQKSACARDTMVIVTYDEFGGSWDHVPPPGQGNTNGPHDQWGPGTRIPTLVLSPYLRKPFIVDHTSYDTTSILATLEKRFGLLPLGSRDGAVEDLSNVFEREDDD